MSGCSRAAAECHSDQSDVKQPDEWTTYIQQYYSDHLRLHPRSLSDVSIFRVPNILRADTTEEYYAPTRVSLGPYHHRRQELLSMEDHKPRALCRMMTRVQNKDICVLARNEIMKLEESIRNSYEEKIDHEKESLAAMLTLDGSFILEILRTLGHDESGVSNHYEPIFEKNKIIYTGDDILQDILMLENQIPLIVLQKLLDLEFNSAKYVKEQLELAVKGLLDLYPFNFEKDINPASIRFGVSLIQHERVHHLLGLLHTLVWSPHADNTVNGEGEGNGTSSVACSRIRECWEQIRKCWDQGEDDAVSGAEEGEGNGTSSVACSVQIRNGQDDAVNGQDGDNYTSLTGAEGEGSTVHHDEEMLAPRLTGRRRQHKEMLAPWLPRAVDLRNAGIKFERRNGGIKKIKFDPNSATIFLPPINITGYTEVLFRNLIAFEMCCPSKFNYVTWYVSLMDDLIDTEEDVALLTKMGIVTAGLGTDANVANLFNDLIGGITVDQEYPDDNFNLEKVNAHYNNKFNVQYAQFVKEYFSSTWKTVALAGSILLLLLTIVQTIFAILAVYK